MFWPVHGKGWFPPPIIASESDANATMRRDRCNRCGRHRIQIHTVKDVKAGDMLLCDKSLSGAVTKIEDNPDMLVTFDGATAGKGEDRVGGAAAVLWGPPCDNGDRTPLRVWKTCLPLTPSPLLCEAWAARTAIELAMSNRDDQEGRGEGICIAGDNVAVVRAGYGTGKFASPTVHLILEPATARSASTTTFQKWRLIHRTLNSTAHTYAREAAKEAQEQKTTIMYETQL